MKKGLYSQLRQLAEAVHHHAYSPYSKAKVGCTLLTDKGNYYSGCNVENGSYGATVCAERVAIGTAISQGEKKIKQLYVYTQNGWAPCGMCRQVIREFATKDLQIILGNAAGEEKVYTMDEIYPYSFGPEDMGQ